LGSASAPAVGRGVREHRKPSGDAAGPSEYVFAPLRLAKSHDLTVLAEEEMDNIPTDEL
jgi:hypothetical protein